MHHTPEDAEQRALQAARTGDEHAFRELVEPNRGGLHAHCYRMLGSLHDADDALQETLLRAWRGLGRFESGRPLRPWLYRIATNVCFDALGKRRQRLLLPEDGEPAAASAGPGAPAGEAAWLDLYPDRMLGVEDGYASPDARYEQRESVELAFVAALQHLPARQRAVLILREVLGFSAREVAQALDTTAASVNSTLQRARQTVQARRPDRAQQATLRALGDDGLGRVVQRYVAAWETRDVNLMVAVLAEDVTFAMPPHPHWFRGRDAVVAFIAATGRPRLRSLATSANGQPALGWYLQHGDDRPFLPTSIEVLALEGSRVKGITAFVRPDLFPRFGLPTELGAI